MTEFDEMTEKDPAEETNPSEASTTSASQTETPAEQSAEDNEEAQNEAPADDSAEKKEVADVPSEAPAPASAEERKKTYKTGTKIAAFVFFLITAGIFALYEYFAFTFLYLPLMQSIDNLGEAIATIFGYIFGLIYTIIFAIAQLPANIIAIILFKRIRGKSDKKWENVLFTVFFALSIVMLIVTVLSMALFFGTSMVS